MFWRFSLLWTLSSYSLEKNFASGRGACFNLLGRENGLWLTQGRMTPQKILFVFQCLETFQRACQLADSQGNIKAMQRYLWQVMYLRWLLSHWLAAASEFGLRSEGTGQKQSKHKAERPLTALYMRKRGKCHSSCKIWTTGHIWGCWQGWIIKGFTLFLFPWRTNYQACLPVFGEKPRVYPMGNKLYT